MAKPHAIPKELVCSECGEDWDDHPKNPRRRDCIELLKDKPTFTWPTYYNQPYTTQPYTTPWWGTITGSNVTTENYAHLG
jgi:hypothetical protein